MKYLSFPVGHTAQEQEILNNGALMLGAVAIGSYAFGYIAARYSGEMPRSPDQDALLPKAVGLFFGVSASLAGAYCGALGATVGAAVILGDTAGRHDNKNRLSRALNKV